MTPNNIIRRLNAEHVTITLEETFSDSQYPDNHFLWVLRSVFTNGDSDAVIGYYNKEDALTDFRVLVNEALGMMPEAPSGKGEPV